VLDAIYGDGDTVAAGIAARELARMTGPSPSAALTSSEAWSANLCVLGQWHAARRDSEALRRSVEALRTRGTAPAGAIVSAAPAACAELLDAEHAVLVDSRDARSRLMRVDSLVLAPHVVGDLVAYAPLLIARLHERVGDGGRALAALGRRTYMSEWPRYLATMLREEARLAERAGDLAATRAAFSHYLAYRDSSAALAPELEAVRRRLGANGSPPR
jgi:hypothetical protein